VKAKSLLKPYPEEMMDAHDVSRIVNSAKYDGPECIQAVSMTTQQGGSYPSCDDDFY
jgi:putative SOS response-associated peptidase YedK